MNKELLTAVKAICAEKGMSPDVILDALEAALKNAKPEDLVYVGGSSFIVADYLAINDKNENK